MYESYKFKEVLFIYLGQNVRKISYLRQSHISVLLCSSRISNGSDGPLHKVPTSEEISQKSNIKKRTVD